ncbi:MAG TPA: TerB family tellurite resistance protein [Polyangia bacterium]|nr:TerB family tellurite resistance protein [Polyangia bacterium]
MKDRLPLVADLLMDAAHADDALEGEEKAAVKRLLREILEAASLPMDLDFRIEEFSPERFDLAVTTAAFANDPPALKRRLLELCAAVHAADGEIEFSEDEQLRRVGAALGLPAESYDDMVVTVIEELELGEDLERLRYGDTPG